MRAEAENDAAATYVQINEPLPELGSVHKPGGLILEVSMQKHMGESFGHYQGAMLRLEEIRRKR